MDNARALELRVKRERAARFEAESLLEAKSLELHEAVEESRDLARRLEETVKLQTRELLSAQRVTRLGTFIWDIQNDLFSWTEGGLNILAIEQDSSQTTLAQLLAVIHSKDRMLMERLCGRIKESGNGSSDADLDMEVSFRITPPDGKVRWVKFVCERADPHTFTGAVQDISNNVLAAKEVREARIELEQRLADLEIAQQNLREANREAREANETKSRFVAMVSHDIRTPINGLLGTLTLLADSPLEAPQRELLKVATDSAESLRVLVNDIIDFARLEIGKIQLEPANFDLRNLVAQLLDFWRPLATSSNVRLAADIDPTVPDRLRGDPIRLRQILNNLLSNAIKFTSDGMVSVAIRPDESVNTDSVRCPLIIEVIDTGIGIDKVDQGNLFKEFSQILSGQSEEEHFTDLSSASLGSGLGLAICRALVEQMNGKISVMSARGQGATFTIRLVLDQGTEEESSEMQEHARPLLSAEGEPPAILVAEDVPANQLVARMLLQSFGCQVDVVNDGNEAIAACRNRPYDVVLMDVSMPVMDGMTATRQLRAIDEPAIRDIPIIGLTAFALPDDKQRFFDAGMNEVICKPVRREELYSAVEQALVRSTESASDDESGSASTGINFDVLSALTTGFSEDQVQAVVRQVGEDLEKYCKVAIADATHGNLNQLARSSHALKGLAASIGGQSLSELAATIEDAARQGDSELAIASTLNQLGKTTDVTLDALKRFMENQAG